MNPTPIIRTKQDARFAYRRVGEGPALMLLHGFPASGILWNPLVELLSRDHCLLIPDLPGAGASDLIQKNPGIEDLAAIVPAVLDDAGIDHCVLAGHSMGGYVTMAAAELYPQSLRGLMLVHSTATADDEPKKEKRRKSIALIQKGGRYPFVRDMTPVLFGKTFRTAHPEAVAAMMEEGLKLTDESMIAFYTAMMNRPDRRHVLANLPFPAAWALGAEDEIIPWQSCLQQSTLPDVTFISLYPSCGHLSMIEHAPTLANQLRTFVRYCTEEAGSAS